MKLLLHQARPQGKAPWEELVLQPLRCPSSTYVCFCVIGEMMRFLAVLVTILIVCLSDAMPFNGKNNYMHHLVITTNTEIILNFICITAIHSMLKYLIQTIIYSISNHTP